MTRPARHVLEAETKAMAPVFEDPHDQGLVFEDTSLV